MSGVSAASREQRVGRYAIQGAIAVGGMATVHYGRLLGTAGFSRGVAIKRLHPQFASDPDFVGMFLDEARLASRIHHPNVVPILDVVAEGGELFLVMDFVAGESLSKLVRAERGGVPIPIAVSIGVGILEGLHAAHEARGEDGAPLRIVHRDVSPQNILVGIDGVAHVIDFGVAKAAGNTTMTREGQVKGKIAYMAPEQIRSQQIDRRADVYAASVVLWEMLTGKRFLGQVDSDAALVLRALNSKPRPPSAERPGIPPELDEVVLRGLHRSPDERYETAREMAQALERSVRPAPSREVAAWVDGVAGVSVRDRTHQMAAFDLSVATELPGKPVLEPEPAEDKTIVPTDRAADASSSRGRPVEAGSAPVESTPEQAPVEGAPERAPVDADPPSRRHWLAVAALAVAMGAGYLIARVVPSGDDPVAPASPSEGAAPEGFSEQRSAPGPAATTESESGAPPVEALATTDPLPPPGDATAAPSSTAPATGSPAAGTLKPPPAQPPPKVSPASPTANCSPPYIITADGVRQYKAECLR